VEKKGEQRREELAPALVASELQLLLRVAGEGKATWEGAPRPLPPPRAGSSADSREEREAGSLLTVLDVRPPEVDGE
jgi:hypothetical protein